MLRGWIKVLLFLSSYIPLFGILIIRNHHNSSVMYGLIAIIVIVSVFLIAIYFRVRTISGDYMKIDRIENVNRIGLEYFAIYIIPFLTVDLIKLSDILSLGILFIVMCFMYVKSDLIYMNPVLNFVGFNIYKIISDKDEYMIISRKKKSDLSSTEEVIELADHVLLGKSSEQPRDDGEN